jgi:hypothetical protein
MVVCVCVCVQMAGKLMHVPWPGDGWLAVCLMRMRTHAAGTARYGYWEEKKLLTQGFNHRHHS